MQEETLKKLKMAINNEKKWMELKKSRLAEAKRLEQNEYVSRYLELCEIPTATNFINIEDDQNLNIRVFNSFLTNIDSSETNKIFVYMGTYTYDYRGMVRVKACSIDAEYRKYWDIEQAEPVFIPIDECRKFEEDNVVIIGSIEQIREEFLKNLLENSQEKAATLIKTKYKGVNYTNN